MKDTNYDLILKERDFVYTKYIKKLLTRGLAYLQADCALHLSGAPGTGKTSLALELANKLERPVILIYGNEEFKSSDLMGSQQGFESEQVVDNFIHSVHKVKESFKKSWIDQKG